MVTKAVTLRAANGRFARGAVKPPGSGRPKGRCNVMSQSVRDAFKEAFDDMGGAAALIKWARASNENLTEFFKLCARLIPHEVIGPNGTAIKLAVEVRQRLSDSILAACTAGDG
jgi:hypothetical protein